MAGLEGFEFFEIIIDKPCRLQFAKMLDDREPQKVMLWESGSGHHRLWDVLVVFDTNGHMYLWCEWEHFSRAHDLQLGHLLVFRYDGELVLTAKVQPILADDELAMVLPNNDLAIVVHDDDFAMVVRDDGLEMVVPDYGLAMVVVPEIPQLGDRSMPIVVEEYIRVGIRHSKRIRMMKEKEE
ncbi:hypothetical protein ZWY2020_048456 [Hordeum vulgare]|nr:hypothetical protein ZWY2020_048456 [Hordeum vulgare]